MGFADAGAMTGRCFDLPPESWCAKPKFLLHVGADLYQSIVTQRLVELGLVGD